MIENMMVPVQTTDYIMDVVSSMERQEFAFSLCFRRVLWLQGLRLDNELLVSVIYHQVKTSQTGLDLRYCNLQALVALSWI